MGKYTLHCLLTFCISLFFLQIHAQTPPYFNAIGTGNSTVPMNTNGSHSQQLYRPTDFNTLPPTGFITKIYFRNTNAGATGTYTNFSVSFIQNSMTAFPNNTFLTGLTTALTAPTITINGSATIGGWYGIDLPTPFLYNNTQSLIVEIKYTSKVGGISTYRTLTVGQKRLSILTAPGAATGNLSTDWSDFGFEVNPTTPCTSPPTSGTVTANNLGPVCPNTPIALGLNGNSTGVGQTYQWQSSSDNFVTVINDIGTPQTAMNITINPTATLSYRCKLVCNGSTPVYSNIINIAVRTTLPGGQYYINSALPTGGNNFHSFSDFIHASECGISGSVVVDVVPGSGPYTEQALFGNIQGMSPTNNIRINGNGETIQMNGTGSPTMRVVVFDGTKYVTIDSLHIKTLGAEFGWGVHFMGGAKYDSITRCHIDLRSITTTHTTGNSRGGIIIGASPFSLSPAGYNASNIYIADNLIEAGGTNIGGGYFGIKADGHSDSTGGADSLHILRNEVTNFFYYGIALQYSIGSEISYNNIHRSNKTSVFGRGAGLYFSGCDNLKIIGNRVHDMSAPGITVDTGTFQGIYLLNNNSFSPATSSSLVANNAIYNIHTFGGDQYYLISAFSSKVKLYHNTINANATNAGTGDIRCIAAHGNATNFGNEVKNNIVSITGGGIGPKYGQFLGFPGYFATNGIQRNNIYINTTQPGATNWGSYNTTNFATLNNFQVANPNLEVGSLTQDPVFLSPATGNLKVSNLNLFDNGLNLSADVPADINLMSRPAAPTPGAFQSLPSETNNAGIDSLMNPAGSFCEGFKPVQVRLVNYGFNTINTVNVDWTVNGVAQPTFTYNGNIPGMQNANNFAVVTIGNAYFSANSTSNIVAWTVNPNGSPDMENSNDTLMASAMAAFKISVSIGNDTTICDNVSILLNPGSYNTYMWNNGATTQTLNASTAGTYFVSVTDASNCAGSDTIVVSTTPSPVVNLGNDTMICAADSIMLDAGNPGASYLWDNGSMSQTKITSDSGIHSVIVTDAMGCIGSDAIYLTEIENPTGTINAVHGDTATYTFDVLNGQHIVAYVWDFGDGTIDTGFQVQHRYTKNKIYTVTLTLVGLCDSTSITVSRTVDVYDAIEGATGIIDLKNAQRLLLYPNPAQKSITVELKNGLLKGVEVYNILGQKLVSAQVNNRHKYLLNTSHLSSGIYSIKIETDKGTVIKKFEILR